MNNVGTLSGAIYFTTLPFSFLFEHTIKFSLVDTCFEGNRGNLGGALSFDLIDASNCFEIDVSNSVFRANTASFGGAIYLNTTVHGFNEKLRKLDLFDLAINCSIKNNFFLNNEATESGGSIFLYAPLSTESDLLSSSTNFNICSCSFFNSSAEIFGGAIHFYGPFWNQEFSPPIIPQKLVSIQNSQFSFCSADRGGSAIYLESSTIESLVYPKSSSARSILSFEIQNNTLNNCYSSFGAGKN